VKSIAFALGFLAPNRVEPLAALLNVGGEHHHGFSVPLGIQESVPVQRSSHDFNYVTGWNCNRHILTIMSHDRPQGDANVCLSTFDGSLSASLRVVNKLAGRQAD
jgi:hypothetical protein